jgi:hypothetical protein
MRPIKSAMSLALLFICLSGANARASDNVAERLFDRMRGLVGKWEGTFQWSDGRAGPLQASYYLTGNGSALVEDLIMGDTPSMTTVYHLDGADLRMTHFCAAQNQPRLKATEIGADAKSGKFSLVDVTNAAAHPAYVDAFSIHVVDDNDVTLQFDFRGASGKKAIETITLKRSGAPPSNGQQ